MLFLLKFLLKNPHKNYLIFYLLFMKFLSIITIHQFNDLYEDVVGNNNDTQISSQQCNSINFNSNDSFVCYNTTTTIARCSWNISEISVYQVDELLKECDICEKKDGCYCGVPVIKKIFSEENFDNIFITPNDLWKDFLMQQCSLQSSFINNKSFDNERNGIYLGGIMCEIKYGFKAEIYLSYEMKKISGLINWLDSDKNCGLTAAWMAQPIHTTPNSKTIHGNLNCKYSQQPNVKEISFNDNPILINSEDQYLAIKKVLNLLIMGNEFETKSYARFGQTEAWGLSFCNLSDNNKSRLYNNLHNNNYTLLSSAELRQNCRECRRYLANNILKRKFSSGAYYEVESCSIRYELFPFRCNRLGSKSSKMGWCFHEEYNKIRTTKKDDVNNTIINNIWRFKQQQQQRQLVNY